MIAKDTRLKGSEATGIIIQRVSLHHSISLTGKSEGCEAI